MKLIPHAYVNPNRHGPGLTEDACTVAGCGRPWREHELTGARTHVGTHAPDTDPIDDAIERATVAGVFTVDEAAALREAPTVRVPIGAPGQVPRLVIVPKSDDARAKLGIGPQASRRARVWARIRRAASWLWVGSIVLGLGACVVEATEAPPRPALGRACEPDYPDVVERCRFEDEPAGYCGGLCNIACASSSTCPDGAACDVVGGGACRWPCVGPADCPDLDVAICDRGFCTAGIDL